MSKPSQRDGFQVTTRAVKPAQSLLIQSKDGLTDLVHLVWRDGETDVGPVDDVMVKRVHSWMTWGLLERMAGEDQWRVTMSHDQQFLPRLYNYLRKQKCLSVNFVLHS